jgi:3'-phosphoadenosine 5'-phosphosulfate sulfotransferase (PAPS reductase)/FAD synthetase
MTVKQFTPDIAITELPSDVQAWNSVDEVVDDFDDKLTLAKKFYNGVNIIREALRDYQAICKIGSSTGKDSSLCVEMTIEAYAQSIAAGEIEKDHPLIIITSNTLVEHLVFDIYCNYTIKKVKAYAASRGVNLHYLLASPGICDSFAVKYFAGDKLLINPTLNSDCTEILKISPSNQALSDFKENVLTPQQKQFPLIDISGLRDEESANRKKNIKKAGATSAFTTEQHATLSAGGVQGHKHVKLAPIKEFTTDEVWMYLDMCGADALDKDRQGIKDALSDDGFQVTSEQGLFPYHLPNASLIRMVYGQGSNERCNYVAGTKGNGGSSCGGKSRYGCFVCGKNPNDKTGESLMRYERWRILGAEMQVRLHDYMARLSTDMKHRAFHARAVDQAGGFHVALQPNVMKPQILSKLVRLSARISVVNQKQTEIMRQHVANGTTNEHPGVKCIADDPTLNDKEKAQLTSMYIEAVSEQPMSQILGEKHAMYLSMRWALDGIGVGFAPLAIYHETLAQAERGEWVDWLSSKFPALNKELLDQGIRPMPTSEESATPQARFHPLLKADLDVQKFVQTNTKLSDFWVRPFDETDVLEADFNPFLEEAYLTNAPVKAIASCLFDLDQLKITSSIAIDELQVDGLKVGNVSLESRLNKEMSDVFPRQLNAALDKLTDRMTSNEMILDFLTSLPGLTVSRVELSNKLHISAVVAAAIPGLNRVQVPAGVRIKATKHRLSSESERVKKYEKTSRKRALIKQEDGSKKIEAGLMSLAFYNPRYQSTLGMSYQNYVRQWELDFATEQRKAMPTVDNIDKALKELSGRIDFDHQQYQYWVSRGGVQRALDIYYSHVESRIKRRRTLDVKRVRYYSGAGLVINECLGAGIAVDKSYFPTLREKICRTQLFAELGFFRFQSYSLAQIDAEPMVKSMEEYRSFKASYILELRKLRNKDRARIREERNLLQSGQYSSTVAKYAEELSSKRLSTFKLALGAVIEEVKYHLGVDVINPESQAVVRARQAGQTALQLMSGASSVKQLLTELVPSDIYMHLKKSEQLSELVESGAAHLQDVVDAICDARRELNSVFSQHQALRADKSHWIHQVRWHGLLLAEHEAYQKYINPVLEMLQKDVMEPNCALLNESLQLRRDMAIQGEQLSLFA